MGRSRVVRPESLKIPLSDDDWILVKKRLNAGEALEQWKRIIKDTPQGTAPTVDSMGVGRSRVISYLLDWSLLGPDDKTVLPLRNGRGELSVEVITASLNSIDPLSHGELVRAVEAHEEAMDAELEKEKNGKDGENESSAILSSPNVLAGVTTG